MASVNITNGGAGYLLGAPVVTFVGGGSAGATATATVIDGAVASVTITNPGNGYTSPPTVIFTGAALATENSNYIQPAVGQAVAVSVGTTTSLFPGETVFAQTGGNYLVAGILSGSMVSLINLGGSVNALPGATSAGNSDIAGLALSGLLRRRRPRISCSRCPDSRRCL